MVSSFNNFSVCFSGSVQSHVWDSLVPSKKRTFVTRPKPSPVEKLTKDLCSILHEDQYSNLSIISEDDLLYDSGTPLGSSEIGYGGVLINHPHSKSVEEESEASSLPVDKSYITNEDPKSPMRSPKRVCGSEGMNPPSRCSTQLEPWDRGDSVDHDGACFSPRRIFASPPHRSSVLPPLPSIADASEGDLLLDVTSGASFAEAEFLYHPWKQKADHDK
ncbi:hypothetical protein GW17_00014350 [Ensete ventricosum]|nr:hypothetical protein GW17_00014350 [Ensete ventricosum]